MTTSPEHNVSDTILIATPGAGTATQSDNLGRVEHAIRQRHPHATVVWTYTSAGLRKATSRLGIPVAAPAETLRKLLSSGVEHVAVLPLHLVPGREFGVLEDAVALVRDRIRITMGRPITSAPDLLQHALAGVLATHQPALAPSEALVLVGHGAATPAAASLCQNLVRACATCSGQMTYTTLREESGLDNVIAFCKKNHFTAVSMVPFMTVTGPSIGEILSTNPLSWEHNLGLRGLQSRSILTGLTEYPHMVSIWADLADSLVEARPRETK